VEVKLGKPTLEDVGETGMAMAWSGLPPEPGMEASGEIEEEWVDIVVAVELEPWPDRNWLLFWQEGDLEWPERLGEPMLDGRRLIRGARGGSSASLGRGQGTSRGGKRDVPRGVCLRRARS
jgi:hypothetical protein